MPPSGKSPVRPGTPKAGAERTGTPKAVPGTPGAPSGANISLVGTPAQKTSIGRYDIYLEFIDEKLMCIDFYSRNQGLHEVPFCIVIKVSRDRDLQIYVYTLQ